MSPHTFPCTRRRGDGQGRELPRQGELTQSKSHGLPSSRCVGRPLQIGGSFLTRRNAADSSADSRQ